MKRFAQLFRELDESNRTKDKVAALINYFRDADIRDAAWAISLLCGRRPRRAVTLAQLRRWCAEESGVPDWLFEESYDVVGDLAETISLLLPAAETTVEDGLHVWLEQRLPGLKNLDEVQARQQIVECWRSLDHGQRFVLNKLLTGGFRVGVSQKLVIRALAEFSGVEAAVVAHRLMGDWQPTPLFFRQLIDADTTDTDASRPYPFCLANPLLDTSSLMFKDDQSSLHGETEAGPGLWVIDWKWDGIRAQLIRRDGQTFIWSRGEELVTQQFPELVEEAVKLPDGTVLDGEILVWKNGRPAPFSELQRRIGRRQVGKKMLTEIPVRFVAFDLLEVDSQDIRNVRLDDRRQRLQGLLLKMHSQSSATGPGSAGVAAAGVAAAGPRYRVQSLFPESSDDDSSEKPATGCGAAEIAGSATDVFSRQFGSGFCDPGQRIVLSPLVKPVCLNDCEALRAESRKLGVEGLMLKKTDSEYGVGRPVGLWWKWKVDPYSCDAVLLYAQRGHGRRAGIYTDYTFAAWDGQQLVPFTKAYSGLTNEELREVDRFIQNNTVEKFGPVIRVRAALVFELAFEGLQMSSRHKSGIAVRFPRIVRRRPDKAPHEADSLQSIRQLASCRAAN